MQFQIKYKDRIEKVIEEPNLMSTLQLKNQLSKTYRVPVNQIELSFVQEEGGAKRVLKDDETVSSQIGTSTVINFKNLGPQISWRTVFLVEYGGPLIIFPLLSLLSAKKGHDSLQNTIFWMVIVHFIKRELETIFVHVFSKATMPFKRVFINSIHYWIFCALAIGIELFFFWENPGYNKLTVYAIVALWAISQVMNLMCHITTSQFRKSPGADNTTRGIPKGWGFDLVSSANYFWEINSWFFFAVLSRTYTSYAFLGLSTYQMTLWALDKHRRYRKQFKDYPRHRKAIFPFIL